MIRYLVYGPGPAGIRFLNLGTIIQGYNALYKKYKDIYPTEFNKELTLLMYPNATKTAGPGTAGACQISDMLLATAWGNFPHIEGPGF